MRVLIVFSVICVFSLSANYSYAQQTADSTSLSISPLRTKDTAVQPAKGLSETLAAAKEAEKYFQNLLRNLSGQFGINSSLQNILRGSVDEASLYSSLSDTLRLSTIRLYPFQNYSVISIDPNENYLLARGAILDFSQTAAFLPNYKTNSRLDSSGEYYIFDDVFGSNPSQKPISLKQKTYVTKARYIEASFKNQIRNIFSKTVVAKLTISEVTQSGAIRLFSASVTKNETFQKIFGGDEVTVDATGNINLNISGAKESSSNRNVNTGRNSQFTPKFEQKQKFNLRGTIGKKVEILFDQDSDREFDFENNIKLTYTGFDDEILQKLEAGNIDLSLPATDFVTTGGQNKGLFGVKAIFKLANLNLTAIASIQRGEKTRLSLKGGGQITAVSKLAWEYAKAKFFFLDLFYRDNYETYSSGFHTVVPDNKLIDKIKVFRYTQGNERIPGSVTGKAEAYDNDPNAETVSFIEQRLGENFIIDSRLGILTMNNPLIQGEILAVYYQTHDGTNVGNVDSSALRLRKIWSANPTPSDTTWNLEMKNIYDLGVKGLSLEDAKTFKIVYTIPSTPAVASIKDINGTGRGIMEILHIDETGTNGRVPDNVVDDWSQVGYGLNYADGYLIFPRLRPFDPPSNNLNGFEPESFPNTIDADNPSRFPDIYDLDRGGLNINSFISGNRFTIQMTTNKKTSSISLGINILESSEEVLLNGEKLEKDVGYTIDYFSGNIELLDPRALQPNADIDVRYEQAQLFQVEKRAIFGARAEYSLTDLGLGQNSFIGTTALFNSQSTINKRVHLGEEPFSNFVWDVNTNLEFNAAYLTKFANYIPLVSSTLPSRINIRAEYAKIFPNPNTSNGLIKRDENGVAYVDDFEAIKRTFPLGNSRKAWTLCGVPVERAPKDRGYAVWYQRAEPRKNISTIATNPTDFVTTLGIAFQPKKDSFGNSINSWAGIAHGFSQSGAKELAESRFIELWVKSTTHKEAKINIELGYISEDQNENKVPDREIKSGLQIGIQDQDDVGLDGLSDALEDSVLISLGIPHTVLYEDLLPAQKELVDSLQVSYPWGMIKRDVNDPFGDNWNADDASPQKRNIEEAIQSGDISKLKPNGLENNRFDGATRIGDLEDLSGFGRFNIQNSYLRYSFSTDLNSQDASLIVGRGKDGNGNDNGWYLYRIPILSPDTIINSDNVQNVLQFGINDLRVWINPLENNDSIVDLQLAEFQLVTSEWTFPKEHANGIILNQTGKQPGGEEVKKIVEISSISTDEGSTYQKPSQVVDEFVASTSGSSNRRQVKEQSLNLKLNELPLKTTAIIVKNIAQSDFRNYGNLRMFVHGDKNGANGIFLPLENESTTQSPIDFFLRFGSDSNNYFEIREPLFSDWAESKNSIDIDLKDLTSRKIDASVKPDSISKIKTFYVGGGKIIRIKGNPSLGAISQLYIGAVNNEETQSYTGEIWVDELRLSNANDKTGEAAKAFVSFNLADLATFNGSLNFQSAEWRTVDGNRAEGRFSSTNSANSRSWNINGNISLQKFYLERWGINLPFTFNISQSTASPKYLPGNDILVVTAKAQNRQNLVLLRDSLGIIENRLAFERTHSGDPSYILQLMTDSAAVDSELTIDEDFESRIKSVTATKGYNFKFSKAKNENNFWLLRYTIDNITSDFNYTITEQQNPQIKNRVDKNWASATAYNLGIKRKTVRPFAWIPLGRVPILGSLFKNITETDFNYPLVTGVTTDFSLRSTRTELTERDLGGNPVPKTPISTLTSTRGYGLGISPFQSLTSSIGVSYESDLRGLSSGEIFKGIAKGLNPFDGFSDFKFSSAVDTIKGVSSITADSLIFNRDYGSRNNFTVAYNPSTFSFLSQSLNYGSSVAANRLRAPRTLSYQSAYLSRKAQIDVTFNLRNFITSAKEPFTGDQTKPKKKKEEPRVIKKSRRDKFKSLSQNSSEHKSETDSTGTGKSVFKDVTKKVGSFTETFLKTVNDVRFNIGFQNDFQMSGLDRPTDPALTWFGYTTTQRGGFVKNVFSFDLDTIKQFDNPNSNGPGPSNSLFTYSNKKIINYGFTYGFNFGLFTLDLRFDRVESRSLGANDRLEKRTITRSVPFSLLAFLPIPVYDLTLRANNIGRFPIFNLLAAATTNMNLALNYTAKETRSISEFSTFNGIIVGDTSELRFRSKGKNFQIDAITNTKTFPQLSFDISWKGNVSQSISFTNTNSESQQKQLTQTANSKTFTSSVTYSKTGFKIPIWFLKKKQLNNRIQFGMIFSYTKQKEFQQPTRATGDGLRPKTKTKDLTLWSIEPKVDYSFTKWITGGAFFKYEKNKNLTTGSITRALFGINVNITIGT